MSQDGVARAFGAVPTYEAATLAEDLDWMLERLQAVGIEEVITVDLTRPEVGMPVARVVIPGLEGPHDHDGYLPGARALKATGERR
jgi:ribosomal protein S12 methylthiotransferase accessory factor